MIIIPLNEGIFAVSKQKVFESVASEDLDQVPTDSLKLAICPFLVVLEDDVLLLDTGLGFMNNGIPALFPLLEKAGYHPGQITKILISHLHKDHIDGIGYRETTGFVQHYPNAQIYIQQEELKYALEQENSHSFNPEVLKELAALPNVVFLEDEKGTIGSTISYEVTGGHSPFHQVFWIREAGTIAFYGADNLPQKNYLKFHLAYKTDFDGKKAMELRQLWEEEAHKEQWEVLFYHDIRDNVVRF